MSDSAMTDLFAKVYQLLNPLKRRAADVPNENIASPKSRRYDDISCSSMRNPDASDIFVDSHRPKAPRNKYSDTLNSLLQKDILSSYVSPFADREFSDDDDVVTEKFITKPYILPPDICGERRKRLFDSLSPFLSGNKSKVRNIPIEIENKPPRTKDRIPPLHRIKKSFNFRNNNNSTMTSEKLNGFGASETKHKIYNKNDKDDVILVNGSGNMPKPNALNSLSSLKHIVLSSNSSEEYRNLLSKINDSYKNNSKTTSSEYPNIFNDNLKRRSLRRLSPASKVVDVVNLLDEEDLVVKETIDLSSDDIEIITTANKSNALRKKHNESLSSRRSISVEPVNSLKSQLDRHPTVSAGWLQSFCEKYKRRTAELKKEICESQEDVKKTSAETRAQEKILQEKFRSIKLSHETIILDEPEEEEEEFPDFTDEQNSVVRAALSGGPANQVLIERFGLNITRHDINSLHGSNWLNDEVINFYMSLLTERSEKYADQGLPRVYAMNTFFLPRLVASGYSGVRRWTRKVNLFAYDIIPVPVHVGGVHWCMAIINLKRKYIHYYDSMGERDSQSSIKYLENYLKEESLDKRKQQFDTSNFEKACIANCPKQHNGSDCGVFSCMFAEYITRGREITFSQENMQYFRRKMIYEIVQGKLLFPK